MTIHRLLVLVCLLAGCPTTVVTTGPSRPPSRPVPDRPPPAWDSSGWTLLGSQWVDGRRDRDTIVVGAYAGKLDKITLVVSESDLDLIDFVVVFGNGERWEPRLKHTFREGERTRALDLPGDDRRIAKIELAYANRPGGGRAKVEIYGKDTRTATRPPSRPVPDRPPPPPPPPADTWDPTGWTLLGSQTVEGRRDRDVFPVGKKFGPIDRIMVVTKDSDLEMLDFVVVFDNGKKYEPKFRHNFKEGSRSRSIDLPGSDRIIKQIEVKYANLPGGGRARIEIYGRDTKQGQGAPGAPAPPPVDYFDPSGWSLIGSQTVEGKRDRDVYPVGKKAGKFTKIMIVVKDSDLEMVDFVVTFENNEKFEPRLRHTFREGSRTKAIDLPGNERFIRQIEVKYANLPGGGKARLEIYATDSKKKTK